MSTKKEHFFTFFFGRGIIDVAGRGNMSLAAGRAGFLEQSQIALESMFPGVVIYGASTFPCARSGDDRSERWEAGGAEEDARVVVRVRSVYVPSGGFSMGELLELDGRELRVVSCLLEPLDVAWSVELEAS